MSTVSPLQYWVSNNTEYLWRPNNRIQMICKLTAHLSFWLHLLHHLCCGKPQMQSKVQNSFSKLPLEDQIFQMLSPSQPCLVRLVCHWHEHVSPLGLHCCCGCVDDHFCADCDCHYVDHYCSCFDFWMMICFDPLVTIFNRKSKNKTCLH